METLEVTREKAMQAYENATPKQKRLLEDLYGKKTFQKNVMERIRCIDDILEDNGLTMQEFDSKCAGLDEDEKAYRLIKLLCKSLNEGWTPNWSNSNEYKYYPWFDLSSGFRSDGYGTWVAYAGVGSRLCFKNKELAIYVGKQFTDIYQKFMVL